jgi:hypothetical protein
MAKLNQIVAIEKSVKSRVYGEITEMHKLAQKPDLFSGFSKQYRKKDEEGEDCPPGADAHYIALSVRREPRLNLR